MTDVLALEQAPAIFYHHGTKHCDRPKSIAAIAWGLSLRGEQAETILKSAEFWHIGYFYVRLPIVGKRRF